MTGRHILLSSAVLSLAVFSGVFAAGADDENAIHARCDAFSAAWNKHDPKALASFFIEDGVLINPQGRIADGRPQIEKLFSDELTGNGPMAGTTYSSKIDMIKFIKDDVVIVDVTGTVNGIKNRDRTDAPPFLHHVTWVAVKQGDTWLAAAARPCAYAANALGTSAAAAPAVDPASLSKDEITDGLKEALANGIQHAITQLGKDGGFLDNLDVKIPMPENLQKLEKTVRAVGQGKMADEFIATMNHAAEQAVPEAAQVFGDAIKGMTVADARGILTGPNDSATQYFRKSSEEQLRTKFLPIVKQATQKVGVTAAYKNMLGKAGPAAAFFGKDAGDLDGYVTQKALDGLFKMIASEEASIRQNPAARTTDLLKKVFGSQIPHI